MTATVSQRDGVPRLRGLRPLRSGRGLLVCLLLTACARNSDQRDATMYPRGAFNWQFLERHNEAARLFNAFDYGHAVLYERLLTGDSARATEALREDYRFLVHDLLVRPPRFSVAEEAVSPWYSKVAWPAKVMFDQAHVLHRQLYDVYAMVELPLPTRAAMVERLIDRYMRDTGYAFTDKPKSMALMDDQPFSQRFRREQPAFNGLIWAYHWLQVGLYDPLITATNPAEAQRGVAAQLATFRGMLADSTRFPATMPMTAEVSPLFAAAHPRAAAIFDNLHMTHDIISDVLATPAMSWSAKRAEILKQLAEMRDGTRNLMEGHAH
jgi:hypothetical protein